MSEVDVTDTIEFDRNVVGVEVDVGAHEVTEEKIIAFAEAIGETNPLYLDPEAAKKGPYGALIAPPCYYTSIRLSPGPDPQVTFGTTGFNASQHCEFSEPMKAGDVVSAKAQIAQVYAKTGRTGTMVFVVRRTTYINQHGRVVLVVESSNVRRDMRQ
ncbi:MAG: dehydratase [Dehalococcoidia bacterium]|nr:dehydratase [Dehalococcoidia bacterium]